MSPSASLSSSTQRDLRQTVRIPRDSDGVGNALRQIFGGGANLPPDLCSLVNQLNKQD